MNVLFLSFTNDFVEHHGDTQHLKNKKALSGFRNLTGLNYPFKSN